MFPKKSVASILGAVLLQEGQPVAYASRALTTPEVNYPQINKEPLAIAFGCEYFYNCIYGQPVAIQTDHKLLLSIMKNHCIGPHHECNDHCCSCRAMWLAQYSMYLANNYL